ncbi:MAG: deoxyribodipyrimidine photo-lyase [bacterium]
MKKQTHLIHKKSLFIFRRDLRYDDNTGLRLALEQSESVVTAFIIDPVQVGKSNIYKSNAALQFMTQALGELAKTLKNKNGKLYFFIGSPETIVKKLSKQENFSAIYVNRDYTPYSLKRDAQIATICKKLEIAFHACSDILLQEPENMAKKSGGFYSVFTPFYKAFMQKTIQKPVYTKLHNFYTKPIMGACLDLISSGLGSEISFVPNKKITVSGSRVACLKILDMLERFKNYDRQRDFPELDATTHLSAYLKFGVCSIREVYHAIVQELGKKHTLVKQLCWRDFFTHIAYNNPQIFGAPFREKYKKLRWNNNQKNFELWCTGNTGFPVVDAGMRELVATGLMHNRVRMLTASFLVKDLHIDWRDGERFFATHLVDYDPSVNNGNWQWVASTGCDAQPYFRIFNPWLQQKKYDKDGVYIKRWIPELTDVPTKDIHNWYKTYQKYKNVYVRPMVEHEHERLVTKQIFARV